MAVIKEKYKTKYISVCCNSNTIIVGHTTKHYKCLKCGNPCDINKNQK